MSSQPPVRFPTEVWLRILQCLKTDKTELWMTMRHVSRAFKEGVETIFRERHLPKTWIDISLGDYFTDDEDERRVVLDLNFKYNRVSEDGITAIFTVDCADEHKPEVRKRLRNYADQFLPEEPGHTIQIRREINDTPIPNQSFDYENLELSCDWRGLYSAFYAEEQCYNNLTKGWAKSREQWALDLHAKMLRGEINMQQMMLRTIKEFAGGSGINKEIARRARIRRQYVAIGSDWNFENDGDEYQEKDIRDQMNALGNAIYLQEFSDESSVEDDEQEDDDEFDEDDDGEGEEEDEDEDDEDDDGDGGEDWEDLDSDDEVEDEVASHEANSGDESTKLR